MFLDKDKGTTTYCMQYSSFASLPSPPTKSSSLVFVILSISLSCVTSTAIPDMYLYCTQRQSLASVVWWWWCHWKYCGKDSRIRLNSRLEEVSCSSLNCLPFLLLLYLCFLSLDTCSSCLPSLVPCSSRSYPWSRSMHRKTSQGQPASLSLYLSFVLSFFLSVVGLPSTTEKRSVQEYHGLREKEALFLSMLECFSCPVTANIIPDWQQVQKTMQPVSRRGMNPDEYSKDKERERIIETGRFDDKRKIL